MLKTLHLNDLTVTNVHNHLFSLDNGAEYVFSEYNFTLSKRIGPNPNGSVNCEPLRALIFRISSIKMSYSSFRGAQDNVHRVQIMVNFSFAYFDNERARWGLYVSSI